MSFLRTANSTFVRPLTRTTPRVALTTRRAAHQDYGSGQGDPKGEKAAQLGKNPSEDKEHPGPPAPSVGKSSNKDSESSQPSSSSSSGSAQKPSGNSSSGGAAQQGTQSTTNTAQPKILAASPPTEDEAPEDVKRHNRAMRQRAEKAHEKAREEDYEKDKVPKDFWAGRGGADRQP